MPYISAVFKNSGAEDAGILPNDVITSVDGLKVSEIGYQTAIDALRGEEGTSVCVTVLRNGEEHTFTALRKQLPESSVIYSFDEVNRYGYVMITTFQRKTGEEFRLAIDELKTLGARGIVFDLRNNLGGVVSAVIEVLSYLVDDAIPVISTNKYNTEKTVTRTLTDGHKIDIPLVVLTNELTASAAELFTAALRDYRDVAELGASNKNITIVGKKTYGKGIMQSSYSLGDGSSVTFTTAYYNPPSGVNYHGVGISPDLGYEVEWSLTVEGGDAQLLRAYSALDEYFKAPAA